MTEALAKKQAGPLADNMERALILGDLSGLNADERLNYYKAVCESVGLNPLTKPFDYINLNGKLTLYAKRECTEQLRKIHGVSIIGLTNETVQDVYLVMAKAEDKTGRTDCSTGAVTLGKLSGDNLANALMKAETKAKRRVTLSICGLGLLDETELETIGEEAPKPPQPNMTVRCAHCGSESGHEPDCPTKTGPKPNAAAKPRASKREPKAEAPKPKQAEPQVIEPEKPKGVGGWFYVSEVKDMKTAKGATYQVWKGNSRGNPAKMDLNVFHKTMHENSKYVVGNWIECQVTAKPSTKDPTRTLYSLDKVTAHEDKDGITKWMENEPLFDGGGEDFTEGGMTAEDAGFDTP